MEYRWSWNHPLPEIWLASSPRAYIHQHNTIELSCSQDYKYILVL
jgi:hypothetical protein